MNKVLAVAQVVVKEMSRRKDFYVLFILTALITLLLGSINWFNDDRIVRYLKEICLLLIWISTIVMSVATAARQIPAEIESRTVFPLLAKPISRSRVLLGKFLGCWIAAALALAVFYLFFTVISASHEHRWPGVGYLQALWMHWIMLGLLVAMTLLGSVVFTAPSSNSTIVFIVSIGILLMGQHLNKVAARLADPSGTLLSAIYYLIPHLEFYDLRTVIIHDWPARQWGAIALATAYGAAYMAVFLTAACLRFQRKTLNP